MSLKERLAPLTERAREQFSAMGERDRRLVLGGLVLLLLLLVGGSIFQMKRALDARQTRLTERTEALRRLRLIRADMAEAETKAAEIRARIEAKSGTDVSAFLEQVAQKANVADRLDSVRQKSTTESDTLAETIFAVKLSRLTQDELATFLYEMESDGYPLQVRLLTVKARKRADETTLNVDMEVTAYRLLASAEAP